jgi:hypothetical protein
MTRLLLWGLVALPAAVAGEWAADPGGIDLSHHDDGSAASATHEAADSAAASPAADEPYDFGEPSEYQREALTQLRRIIAFHDNPAIIASDESYRDFRLADETYAFLHRDHDKLLKDLPDDLFAELISGMDLVDKFRDGTPPCFYK